MLVFESLNCIVCKEPFARAADQPRSPRILGCGLAMCNTCFANQWNLGYQKHQCNLQNSCFHNGNFAYSLIDVLSQEDVLTLTPENRGYVLSKPLKVPKCAICHDEYSNVAEGKNASHINCGHIICTECHLKMLRERGAITCPFCRSMDNGYQLYGSTAERNRFNDFLDELPKMTQQMEGIEKKNGSCDDCQESDKVDKMLFCLECNSESCGFCAFRKHRSHNAIPLLEMKAGGMLKEFRQVVKTYEDSFPELHKELIAGMDALKTKLTSKEDALKDVPSTVLLRKKHEAFIKLKTDFEATAEEYLPQLRKIDTKVKEMMKILDDESAV